MKQLRKISRDESGVILITVILLTIVISVIAVSIINLNVNQVKVSQQSVKGVQAQQLAKSMMLKYQQLQWEGCPDPPCAVAGVCDDTCFPDITADGVTYSMTITPSTNSLEGPEGNTNSVIIEINY